MSIKVGQRLRSATCTTEVIVVRAADTCVQFECGGQPMEDVASTRSRPADAPGSPGTLLGKRYTDLDQTIEVLCTKAGSGLLSVNGVELVVKAPRPLPSSD